MRFTVPRLLHRCIILSQNTGLASLSLTLYLPVPSSFLWWALINLMVGAPLNSNKQTSLLWSPLSPCLTCSCPTPPSLLQLQPLAPVCLAHHNNQRLEVASSAPNRPRSALPPPRPPRGSRASDNRPAPLEEPDCSEPPPINHCSVRDGWLGRAYWGEGVLTVMLTQINISFVV